jgi:hypothetical protein
MFRANQIVAKHFTTMPNIVPAKAGIGNRVLTTRFQSLIRSIFNAFQKKKDLAIKKHGPTKI